MGAPRGRLAPAAPPGGIPYAPSEEAAGKKPEGDRGRALRGGGAVVPASGDGGGGGGTFTNTAPRSGGERAAAGAGGHGQVEGTVRRLEPGTTETKTFITHL